MTDNIAQIAHFQLKNPKVYIRREQNNKIGNTSNRKWLTIAWPKSEVNIKKMKRKDYKNFMI